MTVHAAFYVGKVGIFGKLIRFWTMAKRSHAELVIDGVWYTSDMKLGVIARNEPYDPMDWQFVALDLTELEKQKAIDFFEGEVKHGYDYLGIIFSQILPLRRSSQDKWFCSELVGAMLQATGMLAGQSVLQSPNQLFRILSRLGKVLPVGTRI